MAAYGNVHLNLFFFSVVETSNEGFKHRGKSYSWKNINSVKIKEEARFIFRPIPRVARCRVTLDDGMIITFSDLCFQKRGAPLLPGYLSAFEELSALFQMSLRNTLEVSIAKPA